MAEEKVTKTEETDAAPDRKDLPPAALRALAEAEERRRLAAEQAAEARPKEYHGQAGPEPTRYGDWEKGGIVSDF
jgi:hypothetical protein